MSRLRGSGVGPWLSGTAGALPHPRSRCSGFPAQAWCSRAVARPPRPGLQRTFQGRRSRAGPSVSLGTARITCNKVKENVKKSESCTRLQRRLPCVPIHAAASPTRHASTAVPCARKSGARAGAARRNFRRISIDVGYRCPCGRGTTAAGITPAPGPAAHLRRAGSPPVRGRRHHHPLVRGHQRRQPARARPAPEPPPSKNAGFPRRSRYAAADATAAQAGAIAPGCSTLACPSGPSPLRTAPSALP